jgi:SNF2 family DNA or RNA helicase
MRPTGGFVIPFKGQAKAVRRGPLTEPLHDITRPTAVVLFSPKDPLSPNKIHVVVDPIVGDKLRPHQVHGCKFLFECVMGLKGYKGNGCILADDMGLGKTLQAITLIWTVLNQSPTGVPAAKRVLIVCPSSLVGNWCAEFNKWLGEGKIEAIPFGDSNKKKAMKALASWAQSRDVKGSVLVASYDQYRIHVEKILKIQRIDLVVCDEGHRLKNSKIKISQALNRLPTKRRVILSGTPIQNDLDEFHAMVDFVNPGILRDQLAFNAVFAEPILKMRTPDATHEEKVCIHGSPLMYFRLAQLLFFPRVSVVSALLNYPV